MAVEFDTLAQLYPLDTLQRSHQKLLADEAELLDLKRGDILFEEGANDGKTIFLLTGKLDGRYADGRRREVDANSANTRYAVGDLQPRRFTATASSNAVRAVAFDRGFLEKVLTWDQISRSPQFALDSTVESARWVFKMLKSRALLKLPGGNLQQMFERFHSTEVAPQLDVITEGDEGDYFYVIKRGSFDVIKSGQVVAQLKPGDSFGEDALISDETRNATVRSRSAGTLMRLSRKDFSELLRHPVVDWITPGQAAALVQRGGLLVDVRLEEEFSRIRLADSMNAPLYCLRESMAQYDDEKPCVVYCETGERSASAAFILSKMGFRTFAVRGGLSSIRQQRSMTQRA